MSSFAAGPSKVPPLNPYKSFQSTRPILKKDPAVDVDDTTTRPTNRLRFSSKDPFAPTFVESRLSKSKNLDPKALYESRIKNRPILLENPARESRVKKEREAKKVRKAKERERKELGLISKKEAKLHGLWRLEENQKRYELFVPLHHLWLGYMSELLGLSAPPATLPTNPPLPNSASMHAKLVKADFHGSILIARQARNPCLVGLSGIVIHETENAFKVITVKDQLKLIPKQGTIFAFRIPLYDIRSLVPPPLPSGQENGSGQTAPNVQTLSLDSVPQMEFELYGNQFRFRSAERAAKKFKAKETIEL